MMHKITMSPWKIAVLNYLFVAVVLGVALISFTPKMANASSMELTCSHEFNKGWDTKDDKGKPIWEDWIKVSFVVDFDKVDARYSLDKSRPSYLKLQVVAYLKTKDGREVPLIGSIAYGYKDGKFKPQQMYFEKKMKPDSLDPNPLVRCEVGSV